MSEKIYALLLRFYPALFCREYHDEALQLFRDRMRDEKGFVPRLRLWTDLLADLIVSVPRAYSNSPHSFVDASAQRRLDGVPAFLVLQAKIIRGGDLFYGGMLSLAVFVLIGTSIAHGSRRQARNYWAAEPQRSHAAGFSAQSQVPPPPPTSGGVAATNAVLDAAERQRVIDAAAVNLKAHYVDLDVGRKMADTLLEHQKSGDYNAITDGAVFASLLTKEMRDISSDMHLELVYSQDTLPPQPTMGEPTAEELARYREAMEKANCTIEKVQILPENIGYLKINSFPDASVCRAKVVAAMASLNGSDAVIFDLRDNTGGAPDMVSFVAAYLFDHPEYFYNPRENTTQRSWTLSPVPGSMLAGKPVYILTSARTFSGAEQFCYDLKVLKRATLVGETTGGAAHSGVWYRIDDHFGIAVTETKPINPFSKTDWAVTGVEPDVKVKSADALETAEKLAESALQKK